MYGKMTMMAAIVLTAACAYGQGEGGIAVWGDANNGQTVTVRRGHNPGAVGGMSYAYSGGSAIDKLSSQRSYWIYSGQLPARFEIVDLTDEQLAATKSIMKEARAARQTMQQETYKAYRETKDRSVWQTQQKKMVEMTKTYQVRLEDILTEEQKALLAKIDVISTKKREGDAKINEVMLLARTQNADNAQASLEKILTPEQKKKLDELMKPRAFNRKARKLPAKPAGGPVQGDPGEMF